MWPSEVGSLKYVAVDACPEGSDVMVCGWGGGKSVADAAASTEGGKSFIH